MAVNRGRRASGEGSIYRRRDGRWCASLRIGDRRRYVYGKTRKQVADRLHALRKRVDVGEDVIPERITVREYLTRWLEDAVRPSRRPRTYESYEYACRRLLTPLIGDIPLGRLGALDIQRALSKLESEGASARQRLTAYTTLRRALQQAIDWSLIAVNPATRVARPRYRAKPARALTLPEVKRLMRAIEGDPFESLYLLMLLGGLRWGEVVGLRWEDVDFKRRRVSIQRTITETSEGPTVGEPKSEAGRRSVALPEVVLQPLREHQLRSCGEWIFTDAQQGFLRRGNFGRRHWGSARDRAGLDGVRIHDLRHTAATLALVSGADPRTVQGRLGHASAAFTLQVYGHLVEDAQQAVATRLDAMLDEE